MHRRRPTPTPSSLALLALAVAAAFATTLTAHADAAPREPATTHAAHADAAPQGALTPLRGAGSCAAGRGIGGCVGLRGLVNPRTIAFAGGGRSVYVGSLGNGGLFQLRRDPRSGRLAKLPGVPWCWGSQRGCRRPPGEQLMPRAIAIPGDERHVYVTGVDSARNQHGSGLGGFARDPRSGVLTPLPDGAICPRTVRGRCAAPRGGLSGSGLIATRDGRFLYGLTQEGIVTLARDPDSGALTQPDGPAGCLMFADEGLVTETRDCAGHMRIGVVTDVDLSPDGRFLYAAAQPHDVREEGGGGVAVFARDAATGGLTLVQVLRRGLRHDHAMAVAVAPDGRTVHVADRSFDLTTLRRDAASGRLTALRGRRACVGSAVLGPCAHVPFAAAEWLTIPGDGRNVYYGNYDSLGLTARGRDGTLRRLRGIDTCHNKTGRIWVVRRGGVQCRRSTLRAMRLGLGGLFAAPDGRHVYAVGNWWAPGQAVGIVEALRRTR